MRLREKSHEKFSKKTQRTRATENKRTRTTKNNKVGMDGKDVFIVLNCLWSPNWIERRSRCLRIIGSLFSPFFSVILFPNAMRKTKLDFAISPRLSTATGLGYDSFSCFLSHLRQLRLQSLSVLNLRLSTCSHTYSPMWVAYLWSMAWWWFHLA